MAYFLHSQGASDEHLCFHFTHKKTKTNNNQGTGVETSLVTRRLEAKEKSKHKLDLVFI